MSIFCVEPSNQLPDWPPITMSITMKTALIAITFALVFLLLFWGGVYYGWLAQTRIPSDQFYMQLSTTLGVLSYAVLAIGLIWGALKIIFRKR